MAPAAAPAAPSGMAAGERPPGAGAGECRVCDWARGLLASAAGSAAPRPDRQAGAAAAPADGAQPLASGTATPQAAAVAPGREGALPAADGGGGKPRRADCIGCRLTGLMAGLGGASYLSTRLLEEPPPRGAHRFTLLASSALLAGLGIARGFGWY